MGSKEIIRPHEYGVTTRGLIISSRDYNLMKRVHTELIALRFLKNQPKFKSNKIKGLKSLFWESSYLNQW